MKRLFGLLGLLVVTALSLHAQTEGIFADFRTSMGSFTCRLDYAVAPKAVANFVGLATGQRAWLDLKMADYSKKRKKAQKTQGFITVRRTDMTGEAVKIPKGHVFKSILDINGEELRFFVLEAATLQKGASSVDVLVEAETEGSRYNVPAGQIVRTLTYLGDVTFSNAEDWIVREGSDTGALSPLRHGAMDGLPAQVAIAAACRE